MLSLLMLLESRIFKEISD